MSDAPNDTEKAPAASDSVLIAVYVVVMPWMANYLKIPTQLVPGYKTSEQKLSCHSQRQSSARIPKDVEYECTAFKVRFSQ